MELNKIQSSGSWGKAADDLNQNFSKVNNAVEQVKNATTRNKGYFSSETELKYAFHSANVGDIAYVGNSYPYAIWKWNGSAWANSGSTGGEESVNLGNYYTKEETNEKLAETDAKFSELGSKVGECNDIYTVPPTSSLSYVFNYPFKKGDILKIKVTTDDVSTQNNFVNVIDSLESVVDSITLNSDYKQIVLPNDTDYIQIFRNVNNIVTTGTIQIHIVCNHEIRLEKLEEKSIIQEGEINRLNENTKNVLPSNQEFDESDIIITDNDDKFIGAWKRDGLHVVDLFIQDDEKDENPKNIKDLVGGNNEVDNEIIASKKLFKLDGNVVFDANTHLFSLAHISDIHTDRVRYEYFLNFIKRSEIDDAICTGDFVIDNTSDEWQTIFKGNPNDGVIKVMGNHDAQSGMSDADIADYMGLNSLYYYKDLQTYQGTIRLVVVNQFDVNGLDGAEKSATFHYSQEQINWFVDTLKNAQSLGYPVIVALHTPEIRPTPNEKGFYQRYYDLDSMFDNYLCKGTPIEDIVNAFQHGGTINETYIYKDTSATISVNTSFEQGVFIAYLAGHVHADLHGVSSKYDDQLYLCETCGCLKVGTKDYGNRYSDLHRIEGDESENSFNVYSFDLWQKKIKVVRVGARMNDLLENRKYVVFDYK